MELISRHVSVHIARPVKDVYEYAVEPTNLAAWALPPYGSRVH